MARKKEKKNMKTIHEDKEENKSLDEDEDIGEAAGDATGNLPTDPEEIKNLLLQTLPTDMNQLQALLIQNMLLNQSLQNETNELQTKIKLVEDDLEYNIRRKEEMKEEVENLNEEKNEIQSNVHKLQESIKKMVNI